MLGKDLLVLDSITDNEEEMSKKAIEFIFNNKEMKRDLIKEQELLNDIEKKYKELENKNV